VNIIIISAIKITIIYFNVFLKNKLVPGKGEMVKIEVENTQV